MYKWLWALMFANTVYAAEHLRGEQLYRLGDKSRQITACITCHGPNAMGNKEAGFPMLAKQHAKYTVAQLRAFKKGTRLDDKSGIMHAITMHMSRKDMQDIAEYLEDMK